MKLNQSTQILYVRSMGKALQVTAIFTDAGKANSHMAAHTDAVVAVFGPYILLADCHDKGISIARDGQISEALAQHATL